MTTILLNRHSFKLYPSFAVDADCYKDPPQVSEHRTSYCGALGSKPYPPQVPGIIMEEGPAMP